MLGFPLKTILFVPLESLSTRKQHQKFYGQWVGLTHIWPLLYTMMMTKMAYFISSRGFTSSRATTNLPSQTLTVLQSMSTWVLLKICKTRVIFYSWLLWCINLLVLVKRVIQILETCLFQEMFLWLIHWYCPSSLSFSE